MPDPSDKNVPEEEKSLRAALQGEIPLGDEKAWDIPMQQAEMPVSVLARPDAGNNPRMELWSRLLAVVTALAVVLIVLIGVLFMDMETLSRAFGDGVTMTVSGLVMFSALFAVAALLLVLALHLPARALVKSRITACTMNVQQRAILELVPSPVFFLNSDALIEDFNSAFTQAMGQSAGQMLGKNFYDLIPKDHQDEIYQGFVKAISGEHTEMRCPFITGRGPRTFLIQAEPYRGHNSEEVHIVALARDISADTAKDEARQSDNEALRAAILQTIEAIAGVVELRDPYLRGHHSRVGDLAKKIATLLKLGQEEIAGIEIAARVHDLGELYVPFEILIKPGKLSDAESEIIRQHCRAGHDILSKIDFPWPIAEMVLQHHECFDGSGYPSGLRGTNTLIGARIIAAADSYDAMISDRPFRAAVSRNEAMKRLTALSGKQFDPSVVTALFKAVHPT